MADKVDDFERVRQRAKHLIKENSAAQKAVKQRWKDGTITTEELKQHLSHLKTYRAGIQAVFRQ